MKFGFYLMGLALAALMVFQTGCGDGTCPFASKKVAEKPVNTKPVYGKPFGDATAQKQIDDSAAVWGANKKAAIAALKKLRAREEEIRSNLKPGENFEVVCGADNVWKTLKAEMATKEADVTTASKKIADAVRAATATENTTK